MFQEPKKYTASNHFFFKADKDLEAHLIADFKINN